MPKMPNETKVNRSDTTTSFASTFRSSSIQDDLLFSPQQTLTTSSTNQIRYSGLNLRIVGSEIIQLKSFYHIQVVDVATRTKWLVKKKFRHFVHLIKRLLAGSPLFWGGLKRLNCFLPLPDANWQSLLLHYKHIVQQRKAHFDSFLRHVAALVSPLPLGPYRQQAILILQQFLQVEEHLTALSGEVNRQLFDRRTSNSSSSCLLEGQISLFLYNFIDKDEDIQKYASQFLHKFQHKWSALMTMLMRRNKHERKSKNESVFTLDMANEMIGVLVDEKKKIEMMFYEKAAVDTWLEQFTKTEEFVDILRHHLSYSIEKLIYLPLEDYFCEAFHVVIDSEHDQEDYKMKIRMLQEFPQTFFGIDSGKLSKNDWEKARMELKQIDQFTLPCQQFQCLMKSAKAVFNSHSQKKIKEFQSGQETRDSLLKTYRSSMLKSRTSSSCSGNNSISMQNSLELCADDFLPIHIFVLVTSNLSNPLKTKELLEVMCHDKDLTGEMGYYLTMFEAAIEYVKLLDF